MVHLNENGKVEVLLLSTLFHETLSMKSQEILLYLCHVLCFIGRTGCMRGSL